MTLQFLFRAADVSDPESPSWIDYANKSQFGAAGWRLFFGNRKWLVNDHRYNLTKLALAGAYRLRFSDDVYMVCFFIPPGFSIETQFESPRLKFVRLFTDEKNYMVSNSPVSMKRFRNYRIKKGRL